MDQATTSTSCSSSAPLDMQISNHSQRCPLESFLRSKKLKIMSQGSSSGKGASKDAVKRIPALDLEDIKIGSRLGKGSFTKVHALSSISKSARKAMERSSRKEYESNHEFVIKRLRVSASSAGNKALKRAFHQLIGEATLLAQLDHPQIAKLRAFLSTPSSSSSSHNNNFALIVDRWDCTLREKIDAWTQDELVSKEDATFVSERLCFALEMAEALEYLHHKRLIYRNLDPRNVGFNKDGSVQLFDFGLCRKLPPKSKALNAGQAEKCYKMTYAGTARYLAPEVHRRKSGYNRKADVYSWAVVCYEMMALVEPYEGMGREEHMAEVCHEGFRPCMDDLPACSDLENLLHQTWCDDLTERLTMKKVCAALEDIVSSIDPEVSTLVEEREEDFFDSKHDSHSTFSTLSDYSWLTDDDDDDSFMMDVDREDGFY